MRRWLVVFLAAAAAVLSFDALRAHALDSGVIPTQAILPREWLASLWALVIDAAAAAGILGVRADRRDPRAWAMLVLAFGASVGFQVWTPPTALARAVPPVVLALAIIVLELPRRAAGQDREPARPAPVRAAQPTPPKAAPRATPAPVRATRRDEVTSEQRAAIAKLAEQKVGERRAQPLLAAQGIHLGRNVIRDELRHARNGHEVAAQ